MGPTQWTVLGGVITAIFTLIGMVWVARLNNKTARVNASTPPYDSLAARVSSLENSDAEKGRKISALELQLRIVTRDRDDLVVFMKDLWRWAAAGAPPPPPKIPDHLHQILPPTEYIWPVDPQSPNQ